MSRHGTARIPEAQLAEIRARLPIATVVGRHVRLTRAGAGRQWKGCCPFHQEKRPSFHVYEDHVHCFGCGAHADVIGFTQRIEGGTFLDAVRRLAAEAGVALDTGPAGPAPAPWARPEARAAEAAGPAAAAADARAEDKTAKAWGAWERAATLRPDDPASRYLAGRGFADLPPAVRAVLRCGRAKHRETGDVLHPVLMARIDGPDGQFRAIHRTYLAPRPDGTGWGKLGTEMAKLSYGPVQRGAIRLFPAAPRLGVAEGIETALAAHALTGLPVWACVAAGFLERVELPFDVVECVVFADRDEPKGDAPEGRGLQAARVLERRLRAQAVRVEIRLPLRPCKDYADVLAARLAEGVAA